APAERGVVVGGAGFGGPGPLLQPPPPPPPAGRRQCPPPGPGARPRRPALFPPQAGAPTPAPPTPPNSAPFSRVVKGPPEQPTAVSTRVPRRIPLLLFRTSVENDIVCASFLR